MALWKQSINGLDVLSEEINGECLALRRIEEGRLRGGQHALQDVGRDVERNNRLELDPIQVFERREATSDLAAQQLKEYASWRRDHVRDTLGANCQKV